MKNLLVLIIVLFSTNSLFSQKHFNNWYFGDSAAISFNTTTGQPVALLDSKMSTSEGCSAISDCNGNLLFYTDGVTVWNKQHQIMKNGTGLLGDWSSSQSALIVPLPKSNNIYYIFTINAYWDYLNGYNYSIVDMKLENGLGKIVKKNLHLFYTKMEKQSAIMHSNGEDIWIVTQDNVKKSFVSYLLTKDGLNINPVISPCSIYYYVGIMKFSSDGKKIAVTNSLYKSPMESCFLIYDFDNSTGKISNELIFQENFNSAYGIEFSKNSNFLYVNITNKDNNTKQLAQYNLTSGNLIEIKNSKYVITENVILAGLQIGPDNKIYITSFKDYLHIIHKPDEYGLNCDFRLNDFCLEGRKTSYGLPSVVQNYNSYICQNIEICAGETLLLSGIYFLDAEIEWTGPNNFFSTEYKPVIYDSKPELSGTYKYKIIKESKIILEDSVIVEIKNKEEILFADSSELFIIGKSYTLKAVENPFETKFTWYGVDSDENEVIITKSGTYIVIAENLNGCKDSATIFIKIYSAYCNGDDIILDSYHIEPEDSVYNTEYLWSGPNGFTSSEKNPVLENVNESFSGDYKVRIITKFGTGDFEGESDTTFTKVPVLVFGDLGLEISAGKMRICDSDSTDIYSAKSYSEYLWSTGETTESITVHDAGVYKLIVKNEFGCSDSAEIEIFKNNTDIELNKGILIYEGPLCVGDSQIVRLQMTIKTGTDLTISNITTKRNSFEIVNYSSYIRTFKNGDVVNIEIIFKPQDAGIYDDELVFHSTEPCEFVKSIPISASAKQVIELSFGEHYSVAGQILEIPILGEIICPEPQNLTTEYEIEVSFDKEYFSPDDVKFGGIISNAIVGNERIIKIKADGDFSQTKSEINVIFGRALLGRSETSQIKIKEAKLTKDRYFAGFNNGTLKIDGCVNDLSGIQIFKPTTMKVAPNPADGDLKVTVGTQEEGSFSIIIYDFQGREVAKSEFKRSDKIYEENDYKFNITGLGTGVYSVHLTAPWTLKREQLVIVK